MNMDFAAELAVARHAAEQAGLLIASRWDTPIDIQHKGATDLVTEIDLASERLIVDILTAAFPHDRIIGEENGCSGPPNAARSWHIDPLDGTTNFSHGLPQFCVSIALCIEEAVVGVVHDPIRRWTFYATMGGGAYRDGRRLSASTTATLSGALVATGFPYDRWTNPDNNTAVFSSILTQTQGGRRAGSAALDLCWVAAGWLDGYWESRLSSWDLAAGGLIAAEAGATLSRFDGRPFDPATGEVVAASPQLHRALRAAIERASPNEETP